jgi:hypothetical protein
MIEPPVRVLPAIPVDPSVTQSAVSEKPID